MSGGCFQQALPGRRRVSHPFPEIGKHALKYSIVPKVPSPLNAPVVREVLCIGSRFCRQSQLIGLSRGTRCVQPHFPKIDVPLPGKTTDMILSTQEVLSSSMGSSWYDDTSGEFGGLLAAGEGRSTAKPTHSLLTGSRNKTALLALACTISPFKGRIKKDIEFFCNSGQHTQLHFRQHCKTYRKNKLFSLGEWAQLQPLSLSKEKSNFRHFFFPFLEARYGTKGPSLSIWTSRVALVFTPFFPHLPYMPAFPPKPAQTPQYYHTVLCTYPISQGYSPSKERRGFVCWFLGPRKKRQFSPDSPIGNNKNCRRQ